jgi:hypothetical protein
MKGIAKIWKELVAAAGFLVGAGGQFIEVPPEDTVARPLAIFCVAVLVSIAYAAMRRWDSPEHVRGWGITAVACLAALLATHSYYTTLLADHTVPYNEARRAIGTTLTPLGEKYRAQNPHKTNADALFDAAGNAALVWTEPSIQAVRNRLRYAYIACAPLVGAAVVAATQVMRLSGRRARTRGGRAPARPKAGAP